MILTASSVASAQETVRPVAQVAAALAAAPAAAPAAAANPVENPAIAALRARLAGSWREVSSAENAANRDAGVERTVEALFVLIRSIARGRLIEANPAFPALRIAFHDGQIEVQTLPVVCRSPEGGVERTVRGLDGNTNRLVQTLTSNALVQTTWQDSGSRTSRFVPSADGQRLTLHVQIRASQLSVPVRYSMTYARVGD